MNLKENIAEGLRSIKANTLRTVLTASIITFGILSLVGILTTIDGMESSIKKSFETMGVNAFDIESKINKGSRRKGRKAKIIEPISYREASNFKKNIEQKFQSKVTLYTFAANSERVKYSSEKTNPNFMVIGTDELYVTLKGYSIASGRNISKTDASYSTKNVLIGAELKEKYFKNESAIGQKISFMGDKFTIIGELKKKGGLTGGSEDRVLIIPIETARQFDQDGQFAYMLTTSVPDPLELDQRLSEAQVVMRGVRGDLPAEDDSFEIKRSDALLSDLDEISGYLKIGGFGISTITLLGACIALMNIMMVSVTERTREIGIRKALGASPQKIRGQFLLEAIVICLLGGLLGVLLGIGFGNIVSGLIMKASVFIIPWNWIILGFSVCVIVGLLSGFYPAYKASKLDPIESLRYE
jgi:putative ABC transport system permease protein